jgi:GTP cyclohydrolase I
MMHDPRNVNLDYVGVKNVIIPIKVKDKTKKEQYVQADVSAYVSLEKTQKGIHMSHIVDSLFNLTKSYGLTQIVNVAHNIKDIQTKENNKAITKACNLNLKFKYFVDKKAPVTKVPSIMAYDVEINVMVGDSNYKSITVRVPVSTCCPCSLELCNGVAAHNQRGYITITTFQKVLDSKTIWFEDLINIAEKSGSCEIYPVLRRPDEQYVTNKMFENAKFVEDCVRDTVINIKKQFKTKLRYVVCCENMESIHDHSAYAKTEGWT